VEEAPIPVPGDGQALIKLRASGVNFIDIYHRMGLYQVAVPFTPGMEGAGVVESIGRNVIEIQPGDRVAYAMTAGSYAQYALVPAWQLVKLPDGIDYELGAAVMLQGMTAHYLTQTAFPLKPGDTILLHAAAGGAGLLIVQMAKRQGARVVRFQARKKEGLPVRPAPMKSFSTLDPISRLKLRSSPAEKALM
jgi:NADPH2:quinone reductase